jgi:adenylosuccinate synthase
VCAAYEIDGERIDSFPPTINLLSRVRPVYEEHEGWLAPTADVRKFHDLPKQAQSYVERLEELLGCPVEMVSVGPEREQIIMR